MIVLYQVKPEFTLDQLAEEVRALGGRPVQLFPPSHMIAEIGKDAAITKGDTFAPEDVDVSDIQARSAVRAFERMVQKRELSNEAPLSWDTPGKTPPRFDASQNQFPDLAKLRGAPVALSTGTPTSRFLIGRVAVAVVIVHREPGPGPVLNVEHLTAEQRDTALAEATEAFGWLASLEPKARVEFVIERNDIQLSVAPDGSATDLEALWRDPALVALGYGTGSSAYATLARDVRDRNSAAWGYVLFITRYPVFHFAYASGERVVQHFDNDGWGVANLNRVIAHETCHIFGALDEYRDSNCNCTESGGELTVSNGNCRSCAANFVVCIMEANDTTMCTFTRGQLGWQEPLIGRHSAWVMALYSDLLGRTPDGGGFGYWINTLRRNGHTSVVYGFLRSVEYATSVVQQAYRKYLDREGEPAGVADWVGRYCAGMSEQDLLHGFLASAEYTAKSPTSDIFVESLYQRILNRGSDSDGKAYWVGLLNGGATRTTVIYGFLRSDEYAGMTVSAYYSKFLDRGPDPQGLADWTAYVRSGVPLQDIVHGFCASQEYIGRAATRF